MSWLQIQARHVVEHLRHWLAFMGLRRLISGAVSTVVVVFVGWWLLRSPAPPVESTIARVTSTALVASPMTSVPTTALTEITVHVAGAVNKPGVYVLSSRSRVVDAITAAGGPTRSADVDAINLALPLVDSEQIVVPRRGEKVVIRNPSPRSAPGSPREPTSNGDQSKDILININTASASELESLPGVGPATAKAIIAHRTTVAPFSSVDDLLQVAGIGPAKLEAMRAYVAL